ncbi:phosphotransferase [Brevibacillus laterosporus]|nr:phosphotransferase [Brevibacillus laterosporus]
MQVQYLLRGMNDTYIVETASRKLIFRLYRSDWRTKVSEVTFEMELLLHLFKEGIPVSIPIATALGNYILKLQVPEGYRFGVLFTYAEGKEQEIQNTEVSEMFGKAVAEMHIKADLFASNHSRQIWDIQSLILHPLKIIESRMQHRLEDFYFIREVAQKMEEKLNEHIRNGLDWGICHGDLQGNMNISFCEDMTYTHYDFDLCGYGWRAYDLAAFKLTRLLLEEDHQLAEQLWDSFLLGYTAVRPFSENDREAVSVMVGIRQLWLMGLCMHDPHIVGSIETNDSYLDEKLDFFKQFSNK